MDALGELHNADAILRTPEVGRSRGPYFAQMIMRQFEQNRETWDADAFEPVSHFIDAADRVDLARAIWRALRAARART